MVATENVYCVPAVRPPIAAVVLYSVVVILPHVTTHGPAAPLSFHDKYTLSLVIRVMARLDGDEQLRGAIVILSIAAGGGVPPEKSLRQ